MNVRIGTAGYAYPAWVGGFYPPGTTQHDMLPYYATRFACVEINSSFYRPPTREQVAKMVRRTPPGFGFTLKVPRSASHDRNLDELPAFRVAADQMAASGRLLGLIFQVPETFRNTADNRTWLAGVGENLRPHRVAVEFRHRSWDAPNLAEWMAHIDMDVVSVGVPDVPTLFPRGLRVANRRVYARLHSQSADNWYADGKLRYAYDYSESELRHWADGLVRAANGRADEALIFFNNCVGTRAPSLEITADEYERAGMPDAIANAKRFEKLIRNTPGLTLIDPSKPPSLFDE